MADRSPARYGTVSRVEADGSLLVALENGEQGRVPFSEITRQDNLRTETLHRLIGRRLGFIGMENPNGSQTENGSTEDAETTTLLSARAYEQQEYARICRAFGDKERNVYMGQLTSVTADGKLAFYQIAQGVTGALHVSSFSLCRVYSFRDIDLPKEMPVIVSEVDERGWLSLSAKPVFGDFEYTLKKLGIEEGTQTEGIVTNILAEGAAAVMLAPNLSVLLDTSCRVYPGDRVSLRIKRVDRELNRLKAAMLERVGEGMTRFDYGAWCLPVRMLGEWVDVAAFDELIRLKRTPQNDKKESAAPPEEIDFAVNAQRSPFSTYANERIVREVRRPSRVQDINFEARMGYLGERHMKVAAAVEALKYSSAWQIRRWLFLKEGMALSERELKGVVDRLVKHDILGVLRFRSDEGSLLTRVLHPSLNYRAFCGRNPRNFGAKDFMETDASAVKTRLAANQLLIGMMHSRKGELEVETHPFLKNEEGDLRLRPRHTIRVDGKTHYLEAVRCGGEQEMYEKLLRYEMMIERFREEAEIIIVVENSAMAAEMARRIGEMRMNVSVWLTEDLKCLPEPVLSEIAAAPRSLLQRIKSKLEEIQN